MQNIIKVNYKMTKDIKSIISDNNNKIKGI